MADMVLKNGKVVTIDANESMVEAIAVKFGKILEVGLTKDINSFIGPQTKIIDLNEKTVIPGLIDSHCHITSAEGTMRAMGVIDASYETGTRSISDIQAKILEQVKKKPKDEWINVVKEDDSKLVEKRHPTKWDLDEVAPNHPVIVSTVGGHFSIVNSRAFQMANITMNSPDPIGGRFERDPKTGKLTGWIHENARKKIQPIRFGRPPTLKEAMNGIQWMAEQYAAHGITCASDGGITHSIVVKAIQLLARDKALPIRMRLDLWYDFMPHLIALGIGEGFGDPMVQINAIKIVVDGAISARTAWVTEPYLHRSNYYGEPAITKELLYKIIMNAYPKGYRFAVHANGERAINMFLDVIEEAQQKYPRKDPRNRIIHCTVITSKIVQRIKRLGILPTIFGPYPYYHGDKILPAFGAKRLERMFAARTFLDEGIKVAAHSDHTAAPYPPLMGIHALVNRKTSSGKKIGTSQRISVMDALKLYTINAAYHTFEEKAIGSIEPGKYADIVVLGKDILSVSPESIINIPIDMTIVGGKIVYQRQTH
ncbi:MAG: amidohydrolase [Candidatus Bathyarchaeota archaeon]|nr:MAG: amidohydrolase [Candidatus Bathyarchaeota archaeon]